MPGMHDSSLSTSRDAHAIGSTSSANDAQTYISLRLSGELDQLLAEAQPRLRRLARLHGLSLDMAEMRGAVPCADTSPISLLTMP